jgi:hypothetical protein
LKILILHHQKNISDLFLKVTPNMSHNTSFTPKPFTGNDAPIPGGFSSWAAFYDANPRSDGLDVDVVPNAPSPTSATQHTVIISCVTPPQRITVDFNNPPNAPPRMSHGSTTTTGQSKRKLFADFTPSFSTTPPKNRRVTTLDGTTIINVRL